MNWKVFSKALLHAAIGGVATAIAPLLISAIPAIPHIDPTFAMVLGSSASSVYSLLTAKPAAA